MPIINKTKDYYPDLENAEYLVFEDPSLPPNLIISKNNVMQSLKGQLVVRGTGHWGWSYKSSFCYNFNTPEEALANFLKYKKKG